MNQATIAPENPKWKLYQALKEKALRVARSNSAKMLEYVFGYDSAWFHYMWHEFLATQQYGLILAMRAGGKSESCTIGRTLFEIGQNPNIRIKIVTETDELASKILSRISATITKNEKYKEVFPHVKPSDETWNKHSITVERTIHHKDATVEACSIMGSSVGGRADLICYDKETQILTDTGWKYFHDLAPEDLVATLDAKGYLEYQKPTQYIQKRFTGDLYCYDGQGINFAVTPGHNMYVQKYGYRKTLKGINYKPFRLIPIEKVYGKRNIKFKKDCLWKGESKPFIEVPAYNNCWQVSFGSRNHNRSAVQIKPDIFAAVLGFYIAEGCLLYDAREKPCGIRFAQNKGVILNKFLSVLKRFPFGYDISYNKPQSPDNAEIRIHSVQLGKFFEQFGRTSEVKRIPSWVRQLDRKFLSILYRWYKFGDASKKSNSSSTTSYELSWNLQEIALKIGLCLRETEFDPGTRTFPSGNTYKCRLSYRLTENSKKLRPSLKYGAQTDKWLKRSYDDDVFCVSVPNRIIYVRRKSAAFWCGNCFDDICGPRNTLYQPSMREQVKEAFYSNWLNILDGPKAKWFMVATPWHINDLIAELRENKAIPKAEEVWVGPEFQSPWPERYPNEYFKERLSILKLKHYNRAYRGVAMSDEEKWLNSQAMKACIDRNLKPHDVEIVGENVRFSGVDLGHREGDNACPSVIFTGVRTPQGKRIPIDIRIMHHSSVLEISKSIIDTYQRYNQSLIMVENNGAQKYLLDILHSLGPKSIPVEGHFTGVQKLDPNVGVPSLLAEIETGQWIVPLGSNGEHIQGVCECSFCTWMDQVQNYPVGKNDVLMASWLFLTGLKKICERGNAQGGFSVWEWN